MLLQALALVVLSQSLDASVPLTVRWVEPVQSDVPSPAKGPLTPAMVSVQLDAGASAAIVVWKDTRLGPGGIFGAVVAPPIATSLVGGFVDPGGVVSQPVVSADEGGSLYLAYQVVDAQGRSTVRAWAGQLGSELGFQLVGQYPDASVPRFPTTRGSRLAFFAPEAGELHVVDLSTGEPRLGKQGVQQLTDFQFATGSLDDVFAVESGGAVLFPELTVPNGRAPWITVQSDGGTLAACIAGQDDVVLVEGGAQGPGGSGGARVVLDHEVRGVLQVDGGIVFKGGSFLPGSSRAPDGAVFTDLRVSSPDGTNTFFVAEERFDAGSVLVASRAFSPLPPVPLTPPNVRWLFRGSRREGVTHYAWREGETVVVSAEGSSSLHTLPGGPAWLSLASTERVEALGEVIDGRATLVVTDNDGTRWSVDAGEAVRVAVTAGRRTVMMVTETAAGALRAFRLADDSAGTAQPESAALGSSNGASWAIDCDEDDRCHLVSLGYTLTPSYQLSDPFPSSTSHVQFLDGIGVVGLAHEPSGEVMVMVTQTFAPDQLHAFVIHEAGAAADYELPAEVDLSRLFVVSGDPALVVAQSLIRSRLLFVRGGEVVGVIDDLDAQAVLVGATVDRRRPREGALLFETADRSRVKTLAFSFEDNPILEHDAGAGVDGGLAPDAGLADAGFEVDGGVVPTTRGPVSFTACGCAGAPAVSPLLLLALAVLRRRRGSNADR